MTQPPPVVTTLSEAVIPDMFDHYPMSPQVRHILEGRADVGIKEYGDMLMTYNGRDAKLDLMEELADAAVYAHQWGMETGEGATIAPRLLDLLEDLI